MTRTHHNTPCNPPRLTNPTARVIVIVEGTNDIEFLRRMSLILHADDGSLPHLAEMEQRGELILVPCSGSVANWATRLQPLAIPEFHLYDRELPPKTEYRRQAVEEITRRTNCVARLTGKRSLENYLHPHAITEAGGIEIVVDDFGSVAEAAARAVYQMVPVATPWELLSLRARKRMTQRAKCWLNTRAAEQMNCERLTARDPQGDVVSWLETIRHLSQMR